MPASTNERQALEREREELSAQLAGYRREIAATGGEHPERRERLAWQIRRAQKRLGVVETRLSMIGRER
jgi:septal ring factor EnvC (AmiA/AmiB activator)